MRAILVTVLVAVIVVTAWWSWPEPAGLPGERDVVPGPEAAATAIASVRDEDVVRDDVSVPRHDGTSHGREWTVRLTGFDPSVPWQGPLTLRFEGFYKAQCDIDANGFGRFVPPPEARRPGIQMLQLYGTDENYRIKNPHTRTATLQTYGHDEFEVEAVASIRGRVLEPSGDGTFARVRAFVWDGDRPREPLLCHTETQPSGEFTLRVLPRVPLLLVAEALEPARAPLVRKPGRGTVFVPFESESFDPWWEPSERRTPRPDLVPAVVRVEGVFRAPRDVGDLKLAETALLSGRVEFRDGEPVRGAEVLANPERSALRIGALQWVPGFGLARGARGWADDDGAFHMRLAAGLEFRVSVGSSSPRFRQTADSPTVTVTAPGLARLVMSGERRFLRVLDAGRPVEDAQVAIDGWVGTTDSAGRFPIIAGDAPVPVSARSGEKAAPTRMVSRADRDPIDLELQPTPMATVRLLLRGVDDLRQAAFQWRPSDGGVRIFHVESRASADAPFVMRVPTGHYRFEILQETDEFAGDIALEMDVDVPPEGVTLVRDVVFGGRIELDVVDARGVRSGGRFTLTTRDGLDVTPSAWAHDVEGHSRTTSVGVLHPGGRSRLSGLFDPGSYTLRVFAPGHAPVARYVVVSPRRRTRVEIRLP